MRARRSRQARHPSRQSFDTTRRIRPNQAGSHLGSTLNPGGAVLTLGVFRRSRSVACIHVDASPSEVRTDGHVPPGARSASSPQGGDFNMATGRDFLRPQTGTFSWPRTHGDTKSELELAAAAGGSVLALSGGGWSAISRPDAERGIAELYRTLAAGIPGIPGIPAAAPARRRRCRPSHRPARAVPAWLVHLVAAVQVCGTDSFPTNAPVP